MAEEPPNKTFRASDNVGMRLEGHLLDEGMWLIYGFYSYGFHAVSSILE